MRQSKDRSRSPTGSLPPQTGAPDARHPWQRLVLVLLIALLASSVAQIALAHGVADRDRAYIVGQEGFAPIPYAYLGAKHMVTGYDHLLFLAGVIFFLYRLREVGLYVTLFAVGHSLTLLAGVLLGTRVDAYLVDAVIGFSVAYKAFENLGGFTAFGLRAPDNRSATFVFGLCHGLGLATKLQELALSEDGLFGNLVAFNVGVEVGQFAALAVLVALFDLWRASGRFERHARWANFVLMTSGFLLVGVQLSGFFMAP